MPFPEIIDGDVGFVYAGVGPTRGGGGDQGRDKATSACFRTPSSNRRSAAYLRQCGQDSTAEAMWARRIRGAQRHGYRRTRTATAPRSPHRCARRRFRGGGTVQWRMYRSRRSPRVGTPAYVYSTAGIRANTGTDAAFAAVPHRSTIASRPTQPRILRLLQSMGGVTLSPGASCIVHSTPTIRAATVVFTVSGRRPPRSARHSPLASDSSMRNPRPN